MNTATDLIIKELPADPSPPKPSPVKPRQVPKEQRERHKP